MATVWVTEYKGVGESGIGQSLVQVPSWPPLRTTKLTISSDNVTHTVGTDCRLVRIYTDTLIYVGSELYDTNDEVTSEDEPIGANTSVERAVVGGEVLHIGDGTNTRNWLPTDDAELVDWFNAEDGLDGPTYAVKTWTSQGGNATVLTSVNSGGDVDSLTLNGAAVMRLRTSTLGYYKSDDNGVTITPDGDFMLVGIMEASGVDNTDDSLIAWDNDTNDFQFDAGNASNFYGRVNTPASADDPIGSTNLEDTYYLFSIVFDATANTITYYVDGTQIDQAIDYTGSLDTDGGTLYVGRNRGATQSMNQRHFGFTFSSLVTDANREFHEGYWAWIAQGDTSDKDFVAALPGGHTYKSAAPTIVEAL